MYGELIDGWKFLKPVDGLGKNDLFFLYLMSLWLPQIRNDTINPRTVYDEFVDIGDRVKDSPFFTLEEFQESMVRLYQKGYIAGPIAEEIIGKTTCFFYN